MKKIAGLISAILGSIPGANASEDGDIRYVNDSFQQPVQINLSQVQRILALEFPHLNLRDLRNAKINSEAKTLDLSDFNGNLIRLNLDSVLVSQPNYRD